MEPPNIFTIQIISIVAVYGIIAHVKAVLFLLEDLPIFALDPRKFEHTFTSLCRKDEMVSHLHIFIGCLAPQTYRQPLDDGSHAKLKFHEGNGLAQTCA